MTDTKDKATLKSAESWIMEIRAYARDGRPFGGGAPGWVLTPLEIENVIERIQANAAEDMRERAAKICADRAKEFEFTSITDRRDPDYCHISWQAAFKLEQAIRNLKTDGGKDVG